MNSRATRNSGGRCLNDAGGATVAAALNHITIERIQPNQDAGNDKPGTSGLQAARSHAHAIVAFQVKDGDRIRVAPILPHSERAIYLEGHVVRPGKFPYRDGMRLNDVVRTYQDLLPEPAIKGDLFVSCRPISIRRRFSSMWPTS